MKFYTILAYLSLLCIARASAQQCGEAVNGTLCANGLCCSQWGYCGTTSTYCCEGCQSQCACQIPPPPPYVPPPPPPPPSPPPPPRAPTPSSQALESIISEDLFNELLLHRATSPCLGAFYTYDAFIQAAGRFEDFANAGDEETRKREVAAFLAQTSHETTGGWDSAPDGRYSWGYCWIREGATIPADQLGDYCVANDQYPCAPGKKYYGRGPIQLSYNFNYGPAGNDLGYDLLNNPDLVENDPYISFEAAYWFWMTPQPPKPSCHDVMIGNYTPSAADIAAGRYGGFGLCTNIINGGIECGGGYSSEQEQDRIGYYKRYCEILGVDTGDNLSCADQHPFGLTLKKKGTKRGGFYSDQ
ncbi:basic endochitinase-like [Malania oleifera]|uniref:basic endochitinase-like n=1 Tax=Malania oleifera TaxID=397392 RepID=UPI0025ADDBCB|nr:basic endochitinase-like [Malania oleifera]